MKNRNPTIEIVPPAEPGADHVNPVPVSEEVLVRARAIAGEFPECIWFWHPEYTIKDRGSIVLLIRHLREYGGHRAWWAAQELWKCL
jgi:hypothetical protein